MTFPPRLFTEASSLGWASRQGGNSLPSPEQPHCLLRVSVGLKLPFAKQPEKGGTPLFCFPHFVLKSETLRLALLNRNQAKAFLMGQAQENTPRSTLTLGCCLSGLQNPSRAGSQAAWDSWKAALLSFEFIG